MPSESTPTAADIEQTQTGLQTKTVANPVQLTALSGGEVIAFGKKGAGILHVGIEHGLKEIIAQIVMDETDFA